MSTLSSGWMILLGLPAVIVGAQFLVRGASRLAIGFGIPSLVVGLTVVAFGTSTPELAVSVTSAFAGSAGITVGNVVGSNIFNVLFILGVSALITPLQVAQQLVRTDVWVMLFASVSTLLVSMDGSISRFEGVLLLLAIGAYTWRTVRHGRREEAASAPQGRPAQPVGGMWRAGVWIALGLGLLVLGSEWLVAGTLALGRMFGISEVLLGLTVVAAGTSFPELATSVVASLRGERDIAVGNVVGSNIFNCFAVLGMSALLSPQPVLPDPSLIRFDIPVMIAVAVACLPIFFTGYRIERWEGGLFLAFYVAYVGYLSLDAARSAELRVYSEAMLYFVLPLTATTLTALSLSQLRARRRRSGSG